MPETYQELQHFSEKDNAGTWPARLTGLALLLATVVAFIVLPTLWSRGPGNRIALAGAPAAAASPSPSPCPSPDIEECVANTEWPTAFEIPFSVMHYERFQDPQKFGEWKGNLLRYQYLMTPGIRTAYFRAQFVHCPNLPGVPLTFYAKACEFLFPVNPKTHQYESWVYSTALKQSFRLASNFGPPAPDQAARYQAVLPSCLCEPLSTVNMPVGNPPGVAVNWFLTSGTKSDPSPVEDQGYYAAIATPVPGASPDPKMYKPPYSFAGSVPGVHKPQAPPGPPTLVPGQLVYDWKNFRIKQRFDPKVFVPPLGYTKIPGETETGVPKVCPVCHLTNEKQGGPTYFIQVRRP